MTCRDVKRKETINQQNKPQQLQLVIFLTIPCLTNELQNRNSIQQIFKVRKSVFGISGKINVFFPVRWEAGRHCHVSFPWTSCFAELTACCSFVFSADNVWVLYQYRVKLLLSHMPGYILWSWLISHLWTHNWAGSSVGSLMTGSCSPADLLGLIKPRTTDQSSKGEAAQFNLRLRLSVLLAPPLPNSPLPLERRSSAA